MIRITLLFFIVVLVGSAIAQDAENVEQVGRIYNYWSHPHDIVIVGDIAYIAGIEGLLVVDISDIEDPEVISYWDIVHRVTDISILGDNVFLACEREGFYVVSIADPENPQEIWHYDTYAYEVDVSESHVFVAAGRGIHVISITDPENPEVVSNFNSPAKGITVVGDYAFTFDGDPNGAIRTISITDPENLEVVGHLDTCGSYSDMDVSGNYVYLSASYEGLHIISIVNPENPRLVNVYEELDYCKGITISGNYAYVSDYTSGIIVMSVEDPENLEVVARYDTPGRAEDVIISGDNAFVCDFAGVRILSVEDPGNPEEIGYIDPHAYRITDIAVTEEYAYVLDEAYGLRIVSIINPNDMREVGNCEILGAVQRITVLGSYAFIAEHSIDRYSGGLRIVSIADPENPAEIGFFRSGVANRTAISGDYAYIAGGEGGLFIVSVADLENPELVGHYDYLVWGVDIEVSGDYAYVPGGKTLLNVISIADPENPERVGVCVRPNEEENGGDWEFHSSRSISIQGEYAYVIDGCDLSIISIADPESPVEVGRFEGIGGVDLRYDFSNRVYVSGNYAYTANDYTGLRIISIADHENPFEIGYFESYGYAKSAVLSDDGLIYGANWSHMGIYRFTDPAGINDPSVSIPTLFALSDPYPNPFNGRFSFNINLPQSDIVQLHLYDVTGRAVWSMSERFGVGSHQKSVDINVNSAGVYFLQASSSVGSETKRVVMLK